MSSSTAMSAWKDIHSLLRTHKLINLGLIVICIMQALTIALLYLDDPIVVIKEGRKKSYLRAQRARIPLSEEDIKNFVEDFLRIRYEWEALHPKAMRTSLSPLVTDGLNKKIFKFLVHLKENDFKDKKISQVIVNLSVTVTETEVVAQFDKLLRVEGLPIPVPTRISLKLIQDKSNAWNPMGLLVNQMLEH